MGCMFCFSEENLTTEHIFPAFMGGDLCVLNGSCTKCNRDFGVYEGTIKKKALSLLNLLGIKNRYGNIPNVPLTGAEIRGMDMKNLNAFRDGAGQINLTDVVVDSTTPDGRMLRQGFFISEGAGPKFVERARAKGLDVIERGVPEKIVVEATFTITLQFAFSIETRKVVAKIALAAIAHRYGLAFASSRQFDDLRRRKSVPAAEGVRVWIFANEAFMTVHSRTAYQHSVMCYLSTGMHKGWALVTLFGGISYLVELTTEYAESESRQFSIFYDASSKGCFNPIVLCDEMTIIGHVLSSHEVTKFEDRSATEAQWFPIIAAFSAERGFETSRTRPENAPPPI